MDANGENYSKANIENQRKINPMSLIVNFIPHGDTYIE
jgi:hypothetical protein